MTTSTTTVSQFALVAELNEQCKDRQDKLNKSKDLKDEKNKVKVKICEILKETITCLGPLAKLCVKAVDALRKSQVGIYFHKGKAPSVKPLSPEQTQLLDDCYKVCLEYQKLESGNDSFFIFLCTGKYPNDPASKKKNKKEAARIRRRNKKGTPSDEETPEIFLEWRNKTQRMFDIYETLTENQETLMEIISVVDPLKKTHLAHIFKPQELEKILTNIKELTKDLSRLDLKPLCTCGCLQSFIAEKLTDAQGHGDGDDQVDKVSVETGKKAKSKCKCVSCGLNIRDVEAAVAAGKVKAQHGRSMLALLDNHGGPNKEKNNNKNMTNIGDSLKTDGRLVDCKFVVRVPTDQDVSNNCTVFDVIRKTNRVEWDYSDVEVDYESMNVSITSASGVSKDPSFSKTIQSVFTGINGDETLNDELTAAIKHLKPKKLDGGKYTGKIPEHSVEANITFKVSKENANLIRQDMIRDSKSKGNSEMICQKFGIEEFKQSVVNYASSKSSDTSDTQDSDSNDDEEDLETVYVDDKGTQTDFEYLDSEIELLDETVIPLCVRSSNPVVKERKVCIWGGCEE